jgi:hypothetical protein
MFSDVPKPGGAQKGVAHRVNDHVSIGMPGKPGLARDLYPAKEKLPLGIKAVEIDAYSDSKVQGPNASSTILRERSGLNPRRRRKA